jgi:hypothetical protein
MFILCNYFNYLNNISFFILFKVGQNTGIEMERTVSLQYPGCIDEGRIMHELLHTLGYHSNFKLNKYILYFIY